MVTVSRCRRSALAAAVFGALGVAIVSTAGPAFAANTIAVGGVGPTNVKIDYSCDASAGATAVKVMVGAPDADSPSATGTQNSITCNGNPQTAVVMMTGTPVSQGETVQVRAAVVKSDDTVVTGTSKLVKLG